MHFIRDELVQFWGDADRSLLPVSVVQADEADEEELAELDRMDEEGSDAQARLLFSQSLRLRLLGHNAAIITVQLSRCLVKK